MGNSQNELDSLRVFNTLKTVVSNLVKNYDCDEEKMSFLFFVTAEPFEIAFKLMLHPADGLLTMYSKLPFTVDEPYREAYATAVCRLNYDRMYGGTFDFSPEKGSTVFRLPVPYIKSLISPELLENVVRSTHDTVARYSSYLYDIGHGKAAEMPNE